jgi:hypothetical protein
MKRNSPLTALKTLALAGLAALSLTGCLTQEESADENAFTSDGQAAFLVSEIDQMGQALGDLAEGPLAKTSGFTIEGELVIDPFDYKEDCGCFVRRAKYTGHKGYERERLDSVTLLDSAGGTMDVYAPSRVAKVLHRRNVDHSKGGNELSVRLDVEVEIKTEGDGKAGVWNGTMTGTFNGQEFKSGTISNLVRPYQDGRFRFPESGSIELTRPVFHFLVEFQGDGKAKVTVKNRRNGRIHILWVDKDYQETPAEVE